MTTYTTRTLTETEIAERLFELDRTPLPLRIDETVEEYASEFTDDCLHPGELVDAPTFRDLPPERQVHVRSCELCSLIIGGENSTLRPIVPSEADVAAAASAARDAATSPWWRRGLALAITILSGLALWKFFSRSTDRDASSRADTSTTITASDARR